MRIHLIAVGNRMEAWVKAGFDEYAKRMPKECQLVLKEIEPAKRSKSGNSETYKSIEAKKILAAIPEGSTVIALDVQGMQFSTEQLAEHMTDWMSSGRDVALLVGGPDGLDQQCLSIANQKWSLSRLTMPHPIVRIVLAEQLYRSWSITRNHPYHRA
ncbi:MAG: 23S rRNA (pseudouridine(1915)-N(3))-methyltransferase RlmH [Gammaproteobacteria bacterium]|nr:23S rRNA (pseudouridine(1915)-N(3))-methyltransferase RlmH [Gammaproteobacteria bacterium]